MRQSKTVMILSTLLAASLPLIGCSVQKDFSQMKDDTAQMNQTTAHMDQTTTQLQKSMDEMRADLEGMKKTEFYLAQDNDALKSSMAEMFDKGRQGNAMDYRAKILDHLKDAETMGTKVGYAVLYFMSFEYQLWTDNAVPGDTPERNARLIDDAVNEFFTMVLDVYEDEPTVYPFGVKDGIVVDKKAQNFNALAAGLEWINREQREMLANHPDRRPISMLSIIENALADQAAVDSGKTSPKTVSVAEKKIQAYSNVAIKLLQARQAFLPLLAIANNSPLGLEGDKISAYVKTVHEKWAFNIDTMHESAAEEAGYFLLQAQATRMFLAGLSDPRAVPQNDKQLQDVFKKANIVFDNRASVNSNGAEVAATKMQLASLVGLEKQFHEK